jgi:hypothetical protein
MVIVEARADLTANYYLFLFSPFISMISASSTLKTLSAPLTVKFKEKEERRSGEIDFFAASLSSLRGQ